ncbi:hypothetical protein MTO96_017246 [Rhipicephalus appendiculatus]
MHGERAGISRDDDCDAAAEPLEREGGAGRREDDSPDLEVAAAEETGLLRCATLPPDAAAAAAALCSHTCSSESQELCPPRCKRRASPPMRHRRRGRRICSAHVRFTVYGQIHRRPGMSAASIYVSVLRSLIACFVSRWNSCSEGFPWLRAVLLIHKYDEAHVKQCGVHDSLIPVPPTTILQYDPFDVEYEVWG